MNCIVILGREECSSIDYCYHHSDLPDQPNPRCPRKAVHPGSVTELELQKREEKEEEEQTASSLPVPMAQPATGEIHGCARSGLTAQPLSGLRKNPVHFREYSHDFSRGDCGSMDSKGGSDDRPVCPYRAECYR